MKTLLAVIFLILSGRLLFGLPPESPLFSAGPISGARNSETPFEFTLPEGAHTIILRGSITRGGANILFGLGEVPDQEPVNDLGASGELIFRNLPSGNYKGAVVGVEAYRGLQFSLTYVKTANVVIFLHGLGGDISSWDAFTRAISVGREPVKVANIYQGRIHGPVATEVIGSEVLNGTSLPNQSYYFYRVSFGAFDQSGGLRSVDGKLAPPLSHGDWESFPMLGREVLLAVNAALRWHPEAKILLVGHSRGGLAGRAFLQGSNSNEKSAVVGFLTLGTPHDGSYFGRLNPYLARVPRQNDTQTWLVANVSSKEVNCLAPSVFFLATGAVAITNLASRNSLAQLPVQVSYHNYMYNGLPLGTLKYRGLGNVFGGGAVGSLLHVSDRAKRYMIGGLDPAAIDSDGIVQSESQSMTSLINLPRSLKLRVTPINTGIFHIEEHDRSMDILEAMDSMLGWRLN